MATDIFRVLLGLIFAVTGSLMWVVACWKNAKGAWWSGFAFWGLALLAWFL